MKATAAFHLTWITAGTASGAIPVTLASGNVAFAADNLADVSTQGQYSIAAYSRNSPGAFYTYNALSLGFGILGSASSGFSIIKGGATMDNWFLHTADIGAFSTYWFPGIVNSMNDYKK